MALDRRVLRRILALVLVALLAVAAAAVWVARGGMPVRDGELRLAGLAAPVEVRWDAYGVPHLKGASGADLAFALGFLHANDRITQLELGRRAVAGRLSEVFGERTLRADIEARRLRLREAAAAVLGRMSAESRQWLEAYSAGVNAWLQMRGADLPPTLRLFGVRPEPWTPVDSVGFIFLMARDLSFWDGRPEEQRFEWLRELGAERTLDLIGAPPAHVPAAILAAATATLPAGAAPAPAAAAPLAPGSNGWAVGPARSADGAPLVANDLHLPLRLPALWYEAHFRAPDYEVAGITLPGVPGVVVGQNAALAWAFTNAMMDDHDVFFEDVDAAGQHVRRGERWVAIDTVHSEIRVRGRAPVPIVLQATDRGPLLPADRAHGLPPRSLAWTAYLADDPLAAFLHLARSRRVQDIAGGIGGFASPAQNLMAADRDGGLVHLVLGRMPQRRRGDGRLPSPGWDPAYGWDGLRPAEDNPRRTPIDDALVTANDAFPPAPEPARAAIGNFDISARARRIGEVLTSRRRWDAPGMATLQTDVVSDYARELVARSGGDYSGDADEAHRRLAGWNGKMGVAGPAALFDLYEHRLLEDVFGDELDLSSVSKVTQRRWLLRIMRGEMAPAWFDDVRTPAREERRDIVARALAEAWRAGSARWGRTVETWPRGAYHALLLRHPLGSLPAIGRLFSRGPFPVAGASTTVAAFPSTLPDTARPVTAGPSMRWVAVVGDGDRSLAVLPGGQSGHPFDRHYDDQLSLYLHGRMHATAWSETKIRRTTVSTLRLLPAAP